MRTKLVMTSSQRRDLLTHLHSTRVEERFAYLLVTPRIRGGTTTMYCHRVVPFSDPSLVGYTTGVRLTPRGVVAMFNAANAARTGVIEVHSHPGAIGEVSFSPTDESGFAKIVPFALSSLPASQPYGSIVVGGDSIAGCIWQKPQSKRAQIDEFQICDAFDAATSASSAPSRFDRRRLSRQVDAIGQTGQKRLSELAVAIIGLGGIGSIVARTLAYEGVREFVLIDPDRVEWSNLNRLDGARGWDALLHRQKVNVLRREIRRINRGCKVRALARSVFTPQCLEALLEADVILGCTDNHASRIYLNEVSAAYLKPYVDIGTGIRAPAGEIVEAGGRVTIVIPGDGCLLCAKAVNPDVAAHELSSENEREFARQRGYVDGADIPAPSVMSLNQTMAAMAVTELKALVASIRAPVRQIYYDMLTAKAAPCTFKMSKSCLVCRSFLGKGDGQGIVERYARAA